MGSSRSEMQCPEFESPMDHQKERTPDRVCVLFMSCWGSMRGISRNAPRQMRQDAQRRAFQERHARWLAKRDTRDARFGVRIFQTEC